MPSPACRSHLTEPLLQYLVFPLKVLQFLLGDFQMGFGVLGMGREGKKSTGLSGKCWRE